VALQLAALHAQSGTTPRCRRPPPGRGRLVGVL